jgi:cytochrome c oxidase subunit II
MMKQEWWSRLLLAGMLALVVGIAAGVWHSQARAVTIRARMPEQGGWIPGKLTAVAGQPLQLRLVSEDVTHGFAIGQMEMQPVDLFPGEVKEIQLTFDQSGTYTYYCTRWCGSNHWRMRGTIEVSGEVSPKQEEIIHVPLYIELGLDIDAPHPAQVTPQSRPSSRKMVDLFEQIPAVVRSSTYYRTHSPAEVWQVLRFDPQLQDLDDESLWSLVAALWQENTSAQWLGEGQRLYSANCAACHGENGAGDGVFARAGEQQTAPETQMTDHAIKKPTDFTDPANMLGASPALLHGKIMRGGMGTGMPYWGPLFSDEQVWALVSFLYTFQFDYTWRWNNE